MNRPETSLPADYFDRLYTQNSDPWCFATSDYERRKYTATLDALSRPVYESALEIGCSIGLLSAELASRCVSLLAVDIADAALRQAVARCADLSHVRFERRQIPAEWPNGRFDLIVLSEVLYYFDRGDVRLLASHIEHALRDNGDIVLVHWTGETDYPLTGDAAADLFVEAAAGFAHLSRHSRTPQYRLDVLRAGPAEQRVR